MPEKKKRKYTFRKNELFPYESGSLIHQGVKAHRQASRDFASAFDEPKTRRRKQSFF